VRTTPYRIAGKDIPPSAKAIGGSVDGYWIVHQAFLAKPKTARKYREGILG